MYDDTLYVIFILIVNILGFIISIKGVENVVLHAGHHEVVQWLGLTFNIDNL